MPLFDYYCDSCKKMHVDITAKSSDDKFACPDCGGETSRQFPGKQTIIWKCLGSHVSEYGKMGPRKGLED